MATGANNAGGSNGFSIADFLVPGLQTKTWDDWQSVVDDLSNQSHLAFGVQDFTSDLNAMALQTGFESLLGTTTVWQQADLQGLPMEQAYDELVIDLSSSSFEQPTTVNTADLIAGPNTMPAQIAHLQERHFQEDLNTAIAMSLTEANVTALSSSSSRVPSSATTTNPVTMVTRLMLGRGYSNKRRMEEQLDTWISNDLGPEYMACLFKILKGGAGDEDDEDEDEYPWGLSSIHSRLKRVTGQRAGVGGGGTGKGRRITSKASSSSSVSPSSSMMVAAVTAAVSAPLAAMAIYEETMVVMSAEGEEDDEEIDLNWGSNADILHGFSSLI
ncbi:hypothetical protein DFQ27_008482 [Actinomortierella ambigua]|uniref:Uncharacterized protein n=1 Tax=Actinomortierella ambigua TaxID=1343610 RepID=A0A9P6PSM5_9FUNG|nr:hypothetical protein DFQ27_008482 [Actinomortierella ambigua]